MKEEHDACTWILENHSCAQVLRIITLEIKRRKGLSGSSSSEEIPRGFQCPITLEVM